MINVIILTAQKQCKKFTDELGIMDQEFHSRSEKNKIQPISREIFERFLQNFYKEQLKDNRQNDSKADEFADIFYRCLMDKKTNTISPRGCWFKKETTSSDESETEDEILDDLHPEDISAKIFERLGGTGNIINDVLTPYTTESK